MSDASPISAYDSQDNSFGAAFSLIRQAIADRAFPGASLAVTHAGKLIVLKSFGSFVQKTDSKTAPSLSHLLRQGGDFDVRPATVFDLASLTKPVATTTMAMILYERGLLKLDAPVAGTVPEILEVPTADPRRREITFRMLLAHSSGLPAYERLFLKATSRTDLLKAAFTTPLVADPGTHAEYSDIGFIILGVALERIAGEALDRFSQREVFGPLAMTRTSFNPPAGLRGQIPPTADETSPAAITEDKSTRSTFRNRIIQGEVQDENASVLGGAAGHAGLFSSAEDIATFAHAMLRGGEPILRPETLHSLHAANPRRQAHPAHSDGTRHLLHRNPENTSGQDPTAI